MAFCNRSCNHAGAELLVDPFEPWPPDPWIPGVGNGQHLSATEAWWSFHIFLGRSISCPLSPPEVFWYLGFSVLLLCNQCTDHGWSSISKDRFSHLSAPAVCRLRISSWKPRLAKVIWPNIFINFAFQFAKMKIRIVNHSGHSLPSYEPMRLQGWICVRVLLRILY